MGRWAWDDDEDEDDELFARGLKECRRGTVLVLLNVDWCKISAIDLKNTIETDVSNSSTRF